MNRSTQVTPSAKNPVDTRARAILARENKGRAERARETARRELEEKARAQQRESTLASAKERLRAMDSKPVDKARSAAARALDVYGSKVDDWNTEIAEVRGDLDQLQPPPPDYARTMSGNVSIGDIEGRRVYLQSEVATLAREAVRARRPHGFISLDNPLPD